MSARQRTQRSRRATPSPDWQPGVKQRLYLEPLAERDLREHELNDLLTPICPDCGEDGCR